MLAGYWSTRYFVLHYWSGYWPGFIVRGPGAGAGVKRKPPQPGGPAVVTDKQLTKVLVREAIEKLGAEAIKKAEIAAANEAFDRKQHFSELGKKGAEVRRERALEKERQKKELLEALKPETPPPSRPMSSGAAEFLRQNRVPKQRKESTRKVLKRLESRISRLEKKE